MSDATREVSIDQLQDALGSGVTLVDVREPEEYADGHVPGARLMPMGRLPGRLDELDPGAPVFVICASGNRSSAMADLLASNGFDSYSVAGGTVGWARSGRELATGGPAT